MNPLLHEQTRAKLWDVWLGEMKVWPYPCEVTIVYLDDDRERLINHNED